MAKSKPGPVLKTRRCSDDVLDVLKRATVAGNTLQLPEQLDRAMYLKVSKAIEALGGAWSKKEKLHVFSLTAEQLADDMEGLLAAGEFRSLADYGAFYTPLAVVKQMAELAGPAAKVGNVPVYGLEPSAGDGRMADVLATLVGGKHFVDCVEIREAAAAELSTKGYRTVTAGAFEDFRPVDKYARILMNPPFLRNVWAKHVKRAHSLLAANGVLVAVVPRSIEFSSLALVQDLRNMADAIIDLPDGTFSQEGTEVGTRLLVLKA